MAMASILLISCQQNGVDARILPTAILSIPSVTLSPKPTLIPSVTPFPTLSGIKPYLLLDAGYQSEKLYIYGIDGKSRKEVLLPENRNSIIAGLDLGNSVSPDGTWLVFYSGSIGTQDIELPVTINLLNLLNGQIIEISQIVTYGYENKLELVSEELKKQFPSWFYLDEFNGFDWLDSFTALDFPWGVFSSSWSPDGKFLAFAGQIDGISSDVYLYEIKSENITRLTDDIQNVSRIRWSADGKYVVLSNQIPHPIYPSTSFHFVEPSNAVVKNPKSFWNRTWGGIVDWLSSEMVLMTGGTDTAGSGTLEVLNVSTGKITSYWDDLYGETAIDHQNRVFAMTTTYFNPPENPGIYFFDFDGNKRLALNGYYYNLFFRGGIKNRFLALEYPRENEYHLKAIALDGTATELKYLENYNVSVSPDYLWLLIYNDQEMDLYDRNDNFAKSFEISGIDTLKWRPDSQGVFYSTEKELYYLDLQSSESIIVDQCEIENCSFRLNEYSSVWLP